MEISIFKSYQVGRKEGRQLSSLCLSINSENELMCEFLEKFKLTNFLKQTPTILFYE